MNLVEVDGLDSEALERVLQFLGQRTGLQRPVDRAVLVPAHGALGKDQRLVRGGL